MSEDDLRVIAEHGYEGAASADQDQQAASSSLKMVILSRSRPGGPSVSGRLGSPLAPPPSEARGGPLWRTADGTGSRSSGPGVNCDLRRHGTPSAKSDEAANLRGRPHSSTCAIQLTTPSCEETKSSGRERRRSRSWGPRCRFRDRKVCDGVTSM